VLKALLKDSLAILCAREKQIKASV
jgi:hypothetical protein